MRGGDLVSTNKIINTCGVIMIFLGIIALIISISSIHMGSITGTLFSLMLGIVYTIVGRWEISMSKQF